MKTKVSMVMMSHLSDIQENPNGESTNSRLNFVKWLIMKFKNTNTLIDADKEFDIFHEEQMSRFK